MYRKTAAAGEEIWAMGGSCVIALSGVTLSLDQDAEAFHITVSEDHEPSALERIALFADGLHYEMMPEWECPAEELPNGDTRHWLAEKEEYFDVISALETFTAFDSRS